MSSNGKKRLISVYLPLVLAALSIRICTYISFLDSPLRAYSSIPGLDMKTLINWGFRFCHGKESFSIYKLILAAVIFFGGGKCLPETVVALQMFTGVLTAVMTAWLTLRISGSRVHALLSGLFFSLYAPEILYECLTLRESIFVFISLFALVALLWARKKNFSPVAAVFSGAASSLPLLVRFAGALWLPASIIWTALYLYRGKRDLGKTLKVLLLSLSGAVLMLLPATVYNYTVRGIPFPVRSDIPYVISTYWMKTPGTMNLKNIPEKTVSSPSRHKISIPKKTVNIVSKFADIFKPFEICNNVNYYFLREVFLPLKYLPGPMLLFPLAVSGFLLLVLQGLFLKKESVLFFYLISFALPIAFFIPLGRYRLVLLPVLCYAAVYPLLFFIKGISDRLRKRGGIKEKRNSLLRILSLPLYMLVFYFSMPESLPLRPGDFVNHGRAAEITHPDSELAEACFCKAVMLAPESGNTVKFLANRLLNKGRFREAGKLVEPFYRKNPGAFEFTIFFAASLTGSGKAAEAEKILLDYPEPADGLKKYVYNLTLAESRRFQGKKEAAAEAYRKALNCTSEEDEKNYISGRLKSLVK